MSHVTKWLHRTICSTTLALLCAAVGATPASAAVGDYTVRLSDTSGSHWAAYGAAPFVAGPGVIRSGLGVFATGDYRSWRASLPGSGSTIVGGRMVVSLTTPDPAMRGRIVVGSGSAPSVVFDGDGTGRIDRTLPSGSWNWVQFDLRSTGTARTSVVGGNAIELGFVDLALRDLVPPVVTEVSLPTAGTWNGVTSCPAFSLRMSDQGSGVRAAELRRADDGVVVASLDAPQAVSLKPGPTEQTFAGCLSAEQRVHGDASYVATVWDVSGRSAQTTFTVRSDLRAPVISGGPTDGAVLDTATPELQFQVADEGSGIADASASIDGAAAAVHVDGSRAEVAVPTLAVGSHVVRLRVTDAVGSSTSVERHLVVVDATGPRVSLQSPGLRGGASAELAARAVDDLSGIDATSWVVLLDGEPVAFRQQDDAITATLTGLRDGMHQLSVRVRDRAGNPVQLDQPYFVVGSDAPDVAATVTAAIAAANAVAARSGVALVDGPAGSVPVGSVATVTVHVVRDGVAVEGQYVVARRGRVVVGRGVTDADGLARLHVRADAPGTYQAWADGLAIDPADLQLRVAPRLVITTSTTRPRAGAPVTVHGRMVPAIRGRRVAVEARVGGVWYPIRRVATTDAAGTFRTTVTAVTPGTVWVRTRILAVGAWAPAISNERRLTVH